MTTEQVWRHQFAELCETLRPAVFTTSDGMQLIDPSKADSQILRLYEGMRQVGYAKGWL